MSHPDWAIRLTCPSQVILAIKLLPLLFPVCINTRAASGRRSETLFAQQIFE